MSENKSLGYAIKDWVVIFGMFFTIATVIFGAGRIIEQVSTIASNQKDFKIEVDTKFAKQEEINKTFTSDISNLKTDVEVLKSKN